MSGLAPDAEIRQGHIDRASGQKCGWANGGYGCIVPGCEFPSERCVLVARAWAKAGYRPGSQASEQARKTA